MANGRPELFPGEEIFLEAQGGYRENHRTGWKPVQSFLTNQRLIFFLRPRIRFQVPIERIRKLDSQRHYYAMKVRDTLCITYDGIEGSRGGKVLFVLNHIHLWKKKIQQLCFLKIDLETIQRIADQLDSDGREILWYLWGNRYARIDQLSKLIEAPNHMHVLMVIRETINPVAEKIVGIPILSFERSKVDIETGEKVLFSWWLVGHQEKWVPGEDLLLDIFDEGSQIQVIMEVRGVETSNFKLEIERDQLAVRSEKKGFTWKEIIHLPVEANLDNYQMHLKNNLLEIRLSKAPARLA